MSKYLPATLGIAAMLLASTSLAQARRESEKSSIIAASDCVAEAALNNANIVTLYRENRLKQVTDWIVLKSSACDNPLRAMRLLHDEIHGDGTGRRFLRGAYLKDLPRAVRERISPEIESRMTGTTPEGDRSRAVLEPLIKGANLKVVNIGANDILTMRESPTEKSRVIHIIPPDGTGIVYQGYTQEQWVGYTHEQWVFVQYEHANGWVNRVSVKPIVPRGGKF